MTVTRKGTQTVPVSPERRLYLRLDTARHTQILAEAERSRRSVAAVIGEAVDFRFPDDGD